MHISQWQIEEFRKLEEKLQIGFPTCWAEAENLQNSVVDPITATKQQVWDKLWDKPFYSGRRTVSARKWVRPLRLFFPRNLHQMGVSGGDYEIRKLRIPKGRGQHLAPKNYLCVGKVAKCACDKRKVPPGKFRAAVNAGAWLNSNFPEFQKVIRLPLESCIRELENRFGDQWSTITVMHFLTDLGMCCKPDIHLVQALKHLGLLGASCKPETNGKDALMANRAIKRLYEEVYGSSSVRTLRFLDKVLMEIDDQILEPLRREKAKKV